VTLKLAASLDGRTAMANGESQWITGEDARADVHRLRAEAGAVLTGAGTVIADDPGLNVRQFEAGLRVPDRIVLDSHTRVPATARVWNDDGARRFQLCGPKPTVAGVEGVQRLTLPLDAGGRVDLPAALDALARHEVNQVLVECGPTLAGALLAARRVDELVLYVAPRLLGDAARGLAALPGIEHLAQALSIEFTHVRRVGRDLRITAVPIQE
jgi:diaminohydroxyphosphoribosylaminopyrimidine deaminase/5-amino-6-(5-phosphoribosylamino)uracil reductase